MKMAMTTEVIQNEIETIVRNHVKSGTVVRVLVRENFDEFDDTIVVDVIFDAKKNRLDASETSQLGRHIWKRLIDLGERGFPSLSFISKSEAGNLAAA